VSGDICVVVNGFDDEFGEFHVFVIEGAILYVFAAHMRGRYNRDRLRAGDRVGVSLMVGFGLSVCKGLCCSALYLSLKESFKPIL